MGGTRSHHVSRAALVLGLALVGAAWVLASPLLASPDEDYHLGSIWCAPTAPDELCRTNDEAPHVGEHHALVPKPISIEGLCFALRPAVSASCRPPEEPVRLVPGRVSDPDSYPGAYHLAMGTLVGAETTESVLLMRFASWVVATGLLAAAMGLAPPDLRRPFAIGVVTTSVPLGVYLFASVNPSGVVVGGVAAYWCAVTAYLRNGISRRRRRALGALAVASAAVAAGSRYDAGLSLGIATLSAVLASGTWQPVLRRRTVLPASIATASIALSVASGKLGDVLGGVGRSRAESVSVAAFENLLRVPTVVGGSLGTASLGWFDVPMPPLTSMLLVGLLGALLFLGLGTAARPARLAFGVVAFALTVVPVYSTAVEAAPIGDTIQPRYLLPLLPVAVAIVLYRAPGSPPALTRSQVLAAGAVVTVAHAAALHQTIRRYTTGTDRHGLDLGTGVEWWWPGAPSPMVVWLAGAFGFAAVAAAALQLLPVAERSVAPYQATLRAGALVPLAAGERATAIDGGVGSLSRYRWAPLRTSPRSATGSSSTTAPLAPGSSRRTSTPTTTAASSTRAAPSSSP